jgi:hypothetical protein
MRLTHTAMMQKSQKTSPQPSEQIIGVYNVTNTKSRYNQLYGSVTANIHQSGVYHQKQDA